MRAAASIALVLAATSVALAQDGDWSLPIRRVLTRDVLCSMESDVPRGECDVEGSVVAGAWTVSVVRPHEHGTYLGDPTMKWHLLFERPGARYGTVEPIHHEVTVCTDDATFRIGGRDAFVLEELAVRDVVGPSAPEVIIRFRETPGDPVRAIVCSLRSAMPRCTGPHPDGDVLRDGDGMRIGELRLHAP